ncbi:hypothetical protein ACQ3I4_07135 [Zafaria sp. Z1313]|uniref:hypothetical protein n=1 Tax=unclassified Zafaria TaxID=2828765 RepID=UPI002E77DAAA|nr:hypothetical protein [Zafaria sp. J156]MEE1620402.1 hypothetical protein [Zafaria sp. J156]
MPTDPHATVFGLGAGRDGHHRARHRRVRRLRAFTALLLGAGVVAGGVYFAERYFDASQTLVRERCTAVVGSSEHELAPDQAANAALITAVSIDRGLPARAATIGIATAVQESKLRNIDYGDTAGPDSRGLFQQRPSQGWGTQAQVMDPVYAANRFYQELETFDFASMEVTDAAQKVQRSAYPLAYADHEPEGRAYASALTGHSPAALNCVLRRTTAAGDASAVREELLAHFGDGLQVEASGRTIEVTAGQPLGWAVAQWAVAHASAQQGVSVAHSGLVWNRAEDRWVPAPTTDGKVLITVAEGADEG